MATRAVLQTFERYQKERVAFVSTVAEMAKAPQARALQAVPRPLSGLALESENFRATSGAALPSLAAGVRARVGGASAEARACSAADSRSVAEPDDGLRAEH